MYVGNIAGMIFLCYIFDEKCTGNYCGVCFFLATVLLVSNLWFLLNPSDKLDDYDGYYLLFWKELKKVKKEPKKLSKNQ